MRDNTGIDTTQNRRLCALILLLGLAAAIGAAVGAAVSDDHAQGAKIGARIGFGISLSLLGVCGALFFIAALVVCCCGHFGCLDRLEGWSNNCSGFFESCFRRSRRPYQESADDKVPQASEDAPLLVQVKL